MKITIDKTFTESYMMPRTKEQAKEFKEAYTDGDLLRMFRDAYEADTGEVSEIWNPDIIRCNLEAFPGGYQETDENHYSVDMLLEGFGVFYKVHFYISQSCVVNTRNIWMQDHYIKMYQVQKYVAV